MGLRKRRAGKRKMGVMREAETRTEKGREQVKVTPKMGGRRLERQRPPPWACICLSKGKFHPEGEGDSTERRSFVVIGTQLKCPSDHPLRGLWPQGGWRRGAEQGLCVLNCGDRPVLLVVLGSG